MVKYFFTSVDLKRIPVMPDNLELDLEMQLGVHADQLPDRLQLNLKVDEGAANGGGAGADGDVQLKGA
jgi:hypothetical protein